MIDNQKTLLSQPELVKATVDFFTSSATNLELFKDIKEFSIKFSNKMNKRNAETFINMGCLSTFDFTMYVNENKDKWGLTGGILVRLVELVLETLQRKLIITKVESMLTGSDDIRYQVNENYAKSLYEQNLIYNVMFGFQYIIDRYRNSIIKIENIDQNKDHSIGTGFLINLNNSSFVITNKHVLKDAKTLNIFDVNDEKLEYDKPYQDSDRDIAVIPLKQFLNNSSFQFSEKIEILNEIITMGYPSIPMTKLAYQVCHKGEINSSIEDYQGNKLFLISAKTSSGNSGSPVIDNSGCVIGIITEELFEKNLFFEKGKLPYYAAIPSTEILQSLNEYIKNCG